MAKPVAKLVAIIEELRTEGGQATRNTRYVTIGALWASQNSDSLSGIIDSEPIEWGNPMFTRKVIIQFNKQENGR